MNQPLHPDVANDDHLRGDAASRTVLTVFGDYQCPVSARLWRVLRELRAGGREFQEVFRHFPMNAVHENAFVAAQAAEAADDQSMFWSMHDRLFQHQHALDVADLAAHAGELGLDVERFDEDLAYGAFADAVRADQRSGISSGVSTTPAVFVHGSRVPLDRPEELPDALVS
jgi:NhaA family Na+:H+ antiporter